MKRSVSQCLTAQKTIWRCFVVICAVLRTHQAPIKPKLSCVMLSILVKRFGFNSDESLPLFSSTQHLSTINCHQRILSWNLAWSLIYLDNNKSPPAKLKYWEKQTTSCTIIRVSRLGWAGLPVATAYLDLIIKSDWLDAGELETVKQCCSFSHLHC